MHRLPMTLALGGTALLISVIISIPLGIWTALNQNTWKDTLGMYLGQMVEKANSDELFRQPMHPYTQALLSAIPLPIVGKNKPERKLIRGEITSPVNLPDQCRFLKRCDACTKDCETGKNPELREVAPGHFVACHCV